ncbi:MAG: hypothetical protein KDG55_04320 [Rhodocyclaceae bacterium]|nr:hypothetical protein [Rhodocyclaceae bacterium]
MNAKVQPDPMPADAASCGTPSSTVVDEAPAPPALPPEPPGWKPWIVGFATSLAVLLLGGAGLAWKHQHEARVLAADAAQSTAFKAQALERVLERAELIARALAQQEDVTLSDPASFDTVAHRFTPFMANDVTLQWAPRGVMRNIYPLQGSEGAIGLDLLNDPRRRDAYY